MRPQLSQEREWVFFVEKELESQTDWIVGKKRSHFEEGEVRFQMEEADVLSIQLYNELMNRQDLRLRMLVLDQGYNITTLEIFRNQKAQMV